MKASCQGASSHDGKTPVKKFKVPTVSIPYYENDVSKDKVALLIYCPDMFIKMHLWWRDFKPENYIEKR